MHFEVPKAKTFKEFGGEYLMIVISILTALALEQGLESLHHRHLAHEASEKMDIELRENIKSVAAVLEYNEPKRKALEQVRDQMLAGIRSKSGDAELMSRFAHEWQAAMHLSLKSPLLRREAWETAVANQAVTWMPREALEQYAGAYGSIRDTSTLTHGGSLAFLDGPRLRDVMSNIQMGSANPQEIFRIMNQMLSAYDNFDGNLKSLSATMQQVVADTGGHGGKGA